ncbi:MAG: DUF177 domain-containing protein [Lachnospiraceae bacterium]|nr:DUF177 domain-containing protein [Lachnospiraceae bacterium]
MLIDLHPLLSQKGKVKEVETELELESFSTRKGSYLITDKRPLKFVFTNMGDGVVMIESVIDIDLCIPCDRCLDDVRTNIIIQTSREVNLGETDSSGRGSYEDSMPDVEDDSFLDEADFIDGTEFDTTKFAYGEILVNLPMKVLCSESCKGICNRCGTNLNHESCGCDTTELDPRMAKALEVFNNFKEV